MALDPNKFRNIVGGITTPPLGKGPDVTPEPESSLPVPETMGVGQGSGDAAPESETFRRPVPEARRFAKTGRPKGRKTDPVAKINKVKVSLFLDERLINELYDWAYQDRIHPGELFDRALRSYRDKEAKKRNERNE